MLGKLCVILSDNKENTNMNIPVIFQFLKEVSANNNREWFNAHKDLYEEARGEFENLLSAIIT
ncbi:DUF2461 family protein, partial [Bacteroides cellulosilyticus]